MSRQKRRDKVTRASGLDDKGTPLSVEISETQAVDEVFPSPEHLKLYADIDAQFADRVFKFGEREQTHRHKMDRKVINTFRGGMLSAFLITLALAGGAIYLFSIDKDVSGYVLIVGAFVPIINSMLSHFRSREGGDNKQPD